MPLAKSPVKLSNSLPPLVKTAVPLPLARPFSHPPDQLTLSPGLALASNSEQLEFWIDQPMRIDICQRAARRS